MALFKVDMMVTVDVSIEVEATQESSVLKLVDSNLIMTAGFVDAATVDFSVIEDSVSQLEIMGVEKV